MTVAATSIPRLSIRRDAVPFFEAVGTAVLAGVFAGALVGGLGGRLVMRISGFLTDPGVARFARTENGNVVGEVTFAGTVALILFAGVFSGVLGGLLWAAVAPWFAPLGRRRGLAFGLYLLALLGAAIAFDPHNFDFRQFGPPVLNILLFAALFPLFGLVAVALADALARVVRERRDLVGTGVRIMAWLALAPAGLLLAFAVVDTLNEIQGVASTNPEGRLAAQMALATIILAFVLRWRRGVDRVSYALLGAPLAVGAYVTVGAIVGILARI